MKIAYYKSKIEGIQEQSLVLKKSISRLSFLRLLIFLAAWVAFYILLGINSMLATGMLFLFLTGFAWLIKKQNRLSFQKRHLEQLERIYNNEVNLLEGGKNLFGDGEEFIDDKHAFSSDLDLFGSHSVFNKMNRSLSFEGKTKLASWLSQPSGNIKELMDRQEAVQELVGLEKFKEKILPESVQLKKSDIDQRSILQWFQGFQFSFLHLAKFRMLFLLFSVFMISLIPFSFLYTYAYILLFLFIVLSILFTFYHFRKVNALHGKISKQGEIFANYSSLVRIISEQEFSSPKLSSLKSELQRPDQIVQELKKLSKLIEQLDYRLNVYVAFFLNTFLFWDIQKSIQIEKWLQKNQGMLSQWLDPVAELDALLSLSIFSFNHPDFTFPALIESNQVEFSSSALGHPLIPKDVRVCNDFELKGKAKFDLITGSNMAGKTTFLRTVGVNAILAYSGSPVCADKLELSFFKIMTYMRIADSLEYNLSTFHAEIQRIRYIMTFVEEQQPSLLLLDELLRGTNSKDRARGSRALIYYLIDSNACGMVSTHDLSLTKLEKEMPEQIRNFHFDIVNKDNELDFDYKIKAGINETTNAGMLLRKLGLKVD